ncbi:MAG: hypothetical protein KGH89_08650 [Thaumarchaeota archaeon]|nr:hypothetical protein [Nitrososphaerota archaeon]
MVGLFSKEKAFCTVCKKELSHKHKPKKSWNVTGSLCGNCHVDLMKEHFEDDNDNKCVLCGATPGSFNLWKSKKEWGVQGWLCKPCFDQKEKQDDELKKFCCLCGAKVGFISYAPKKEWNLKGQVCKNCWNSRTKN